MVNIAPLPVISIRVIDKKDSVLLTKSKKKYPFILKNEILISVFEEKNNIDFSFKIPQKYIWNGADIPKIFFCFGQSKDNNYLLASMVHDFMLENRKYIYNTVLKQSITINEYRKLTSLIFREILKDEKTNVIKANCMAFGVDYFQKFICRKQWADLKEG